MTRGWRRARRVRRGGAAAVLFAAALLNSPGAAGAAAPLATVASLDLDRYLGRWHEIARLPNRFQRDCAGDVTADYSRLDGGLIGVRNACRTRGGESESADGTARPVGNADDGKLEMTFLRILGWPVWVTAGDYWVIGLDPDYRWAVVGAPDRDTGWILARDAVLQPEVLHGLGERLAAAGYDPCRFVLSETATEPAPRRLCDVEFSPAPAAPAAVEGDAERPAGSDPGSDAGGDAPR